MRIQVALALVAVLLKCASAAEAASIGYGAYVHGVINNADCRQYSTSAAGNPSCMFAGTDPRFFSPSFFGPVVSTSVTAATSSIADGDEWIGASASLATGDLSIAMNNDASAFYSNVTAFMWDTITFHFNDTAQHLVTVRMAGEVSGTLGNAGYRLELGQTPDPNLTPKYLMGDGFSWLADGPYSASASLLVQDGMTVNLIAMLWMFGGSNTVALAFDPLTFDLDGGTFTSESGVLLAQTVPAPEPATFLLFGTGLSAAALLRRRRPGRHPR